MSVGKRSGDKPFNVEFCDRSMFCKFCFFFLNLLLIIRFTFPFCSNNFYAHILLYSSLSSSLFCLALFKDLFPWNFSPFLVLFHLLYPVMLFISSLCSPCLYLHFFPPLLFLVNFTV